jgi:uncharacterized protein (DUF433 family)
VVEIKVADEVWVAMALLHREYPRRDSFRVGEIIARLDREGIYGVRRPGVSTHVSQHCVANKPPDGGGYRMLVAVPDGGRRLYRNGDEAHPARQGKVTPREDDLPAAYTYLLRWYWDEYASPGAARGTSAGRNVVALRESSGFYTPEALQSHIEVDEKVLGGKPVIAGTRLAVEFIIELLALGWSVDEVVRNYPGVSPEAIRACLAYASIVLKAERVHAFSIQQR